MSCFRLFLLRQYSEPILLREASDPSSYVKFQTSLTSFHTPFSYVKFQAPSSYAVSSFVKFQTPSHTSSFRPFLFHLVSDLSLNIVSHPSFYVNFQTFPSIPYLLFKPSFCLFTRSFIFDIHLNIPSLCSPDPYLFVHSYPSTHR